MTKKAKFLIATWQQDGKQMQVTAAYQFNKSDKYLEQWLRNFLPGDATDVSWRVEVSQ